MSERITRADLDRIAATVSEGLADGFSGEHRDWALQSPVVVVATKCGICHETNGEHLLSCPTRWYR